LFSHKAVCTCDVLSINQSLDLLNETYAVKTKAAMETQYFSSSRAGESRQRTQVFTAV